MGSNRIKNMIRNVGDNNLILSGMSTELVEDVKESMKGAVCTTDSVNDWTEERKKRVSYEMSLKNCRCPS
eukprot:UN02078